MAHTRAAERDVSATAGETRCQVRWALRNLEAARERGEGGEGTEETKGGSCRRGLLRNSSSALRRSSAPRLGKKRRRRVEGEAGRATRRPFLRPEASHCGSLRLVEDGHRHRRCAEGAQCLSKSPPQLLNSLLRAERLKRSSEEREGWRGERKFVLVPLFFCMPEDSAHGATLALILSIPLSFLSLSLLRWSISEKRKREREEGRLVALGPKQLSTHLAQSSRACGSGGGAAESNAGESGAGSSKSHGGRSGGGGHNEDQGESTASEGKEKKNGAPPRTPLSFTRFVSFLQKRAKKTTPAVDSDCPQWRRELVLGRVRTADFWCVRPAP